MDRGTNPLNSANHVTKPVITASDDALAGRSAKSSAVSEGSRKLFQNCTNADLAVPYAEEVVGAQAAEIKSEPARARDAEAESGRKPAPAISRASLASTGPTPKECPAPGSAYQLHDLT